jgi:hypothetical protein
VNMDKQLYNPERLFQNRGAQLLQEERDRRAAQKVRSRTITVLNSHNKKNLKSVLCNICALRSYRPCFIPYECTVFVHVQYSHTVCSSISF